MTSPSATATSTEAPPREIVDDLRNGFLGLGKGKEEDGQENSAVIRNQVSGCTGIIWLHTPLCETGEFTFHHSDSSEACKCAVKTSGADPGGKMNGLPAGMESLRLDLVDGRGVGYRFGVLLAGLAVMKVSLGMAVPEVVREKIRKDCAFVIDQV